MKALFFDSSPTMAAKNLLPIADFINSKEEFFNATFVCAELSSNVDYEYNEKSKQSLTKFDNYKYKTLKSFNLRKIKTFLEDEQPELLFIDRYTIYDQLWVGIANKLGIVTIKLQHGFELDSVNWKHFSMISKFNKGIRLTYAAFNISRLIRVSFFRLFAQYYLYIFWGKNFKNKLLSNHILHPTKTFVYSEYYKTFWKKKYDFQFKNMEVITPADFLLIDSVKKKNRIKGCCYITQTLVEDGRMLRSEFLDLMDHYKTVASKVETFIIKLHPRSDLSLYESFKKLDNIIITRDFPNCTSYLTHYSSMAFTSAFLTNNVIIHELGNNQTPELFKKVATQIVSNIEELITAIDKNKGKDLPDFDKRKQELEYYCVYEDIYPYEKIYNQIKLLL